MMIDTQINYNVIKDAGSLTITIEGVSMETIKSIIDSVREATMTSTDNNMRREVIRQAEWSGIGGSRKISYIKAYRQMAGVDLRGAKDWVEANFTVEELQ